MKAKKSHPFCNRRKADSSEEMHGRCHFRPSYITANVEVKRPTGSLRILSAGKAVVVIEIQLCICRVSELVNRGFLINAIYNPAGMNR